MKRLDSGSVCDTPEGSGFPRMCTFPALLPTRSGALLCAFRMGSAWASPDGVGVIMASPGVGRPWNVRPNPFDAAPPRPGGDLRRIVLAELDDGTITAFASVLETPGSSPTRGRLLMSRSSDGGTTWSAPYRMDTGDTRAAALAGPAVHMKGHGWILPLEPLDPDEGPARGPHDCHALFSADGRSFTVRAEVASDSAEGLSFLSPRHAFNPRTRMLVAMFGARDRSIGSDRPLHIAYGDPEDLSWERPRPTGLCGRIAQPVPSDDGRLFAFYEHDRTGEESLRLVESPDGGLTWATDRELVVFDPAGTVGDRPRDTTAPPVRMFGHPTATLLDDRHVLLAYYAGPRADSLGVRWALIDLA
jgi:hypothetical protein